MSETDNQELGPLAVVAAVVLVLLGAASYAGTDCSDLIGRLYDGMIYLGDSITVFSLVGGAAAVAVNRFVAPDEPRPTAKRGSSSSGNLFLRVLGFGGRGTRSARTHEDEDGQSSEARTILAIRFFLVLLLCGLLLTVAGWWMAGTNEVQCTSGFWSTFLSGRLPP